MRDKIRLWLSVAFCPDTHTVAPNIPTPKMIRAACKAMSPGEREGKPWVSNAEKHTIRYQYMLAEIATPTP